MADDKPCWSCTDVLTDEKEVLVRAVWVLSWFLPSCHQGEAFWHRAQEPRPEAFKKKSAPWYIRPFYCVRAQSW